MFSYKHCLNSSFWNFFCFFLPCYWPSTQSTCNFSHSVFKIVLLLAVPLYFFSSGQFIPVEGKTPSFIWLVTVESARKPPRIPQFKLWATSILFYQMRLILPHKCLKFSKQPALLSIYFPISSFLLRPNTRMLPSLQALKNQGEFISFLCRCWLLKSLQRAIWRCGITSAQVHHMLPSQKQSVCKQEWCKKINPKQEIQAWPQFVSRDVFVPPYMLLKIAIVTIFNWA